MREKKEEVMELKVKKSENFSEWYSQVVVKSGLADYAPISGCMIIKPYGFAIWEKIREWFDGVLKSTGVSNAYFPMFIPETFLRKESEHFEGFVPEVAWIESKEGEERYALRPTSETIMYDAYSKWIRSWRDLPLRINQWNNIVRWEVKATKLFLRTREFLWQEGHTAHTKGEEAEEEMMLRLKQYVDLASSQLAIPTLSGKKSESEKFAGALKTMTFEALMPDGKALQMGTSHNLGQHFAKVFDIRFRDKDGKEKYVWQTSWGISTRLIGAVVMVHGDDKGLILPPNIAPIQIIIIPIYDNKTRLKVLKAAKAIETSLRKFSVELDDREEYSPGWKFNEWELKGVPLRIEIGPKDLRKRQVIFVRRDTGKKFPIKQTNLEKEAERFLKSIQKNLYEKAKRFLHENIKEAKNFKELEKLIKNKKMVKTYWCGSSECEEEIKDKTTATIRLIANENAKQGKCVLCGKRTKTIVYFAKAY
jgi:prolyl-tRNA synthetase